MATTAAAGRATRAATRGGGGFHGRRRLTGWLMVSPTVAIILALGIFPLLYSLALSFQRRDLQHPNEDAFVGLGNYQGALADGRVWGALRNTAILVVGGVGLELLLGLGLALVVADDLRGRRLIVPLLMLPVMMVPVVVGFTWRTLWDNQYGAVNQVISWVLGREVTIVWLAQTGTALTALLVTEVWQWTPFMFLVLLAGLTGLNPELHEAAALDGAGWWQNLRDVTLPGLAPVIAVAVLFRALDAFKIFDLVFMLTQGQPGTSTETISWYIFQLGYRFFNMGYAAAISYLVLILLSVLATLYVNRFLREDLV